jgi:hypothetical protein
MEIPGQISAEIDRKWEQLALSTRTGTDREGPEMTLRRAFAECPLFARSGRAAADELRSLIGQGREALPSIDANSRGRVAAATWQVDPRGR